MPPSKEVIEQQQNLLETHRRTLAHLCEKAAQYGGEPLAPTDTAHGLYEVRQNISRIKKFLRKSGVHVEDNPNDEKIPSPRPTLNIHVHPPAPIPAPPASKQPLQNGASTGMDRRDDMRESAPASSGNQLPTRGPPGQHNPKNYGQYPEKIKTRR